MCFVIERHVSVSHFSTEAPAGSDLTLIPGLCSVLQEPSTKRSKLVSRVTSLASLLPPVKTTPLKRIGQTLQVSGQSGVAYVFLSIKIGAKAET